MNRSRTLILAAVLALPLAACGTGDASDAPSDEPAASDGAIPSEDAGATGPTVNLSNFAFSSEEVTVSVGQPITFRNADSAEHTVTEGVDGAAADDPVVNERLDAGAEIEVSFDEAGTYQITCLLHPTMNMTVVVEG
jgi:plastocyanin